MIIDVDNFKTVNDRFGHLWGDAVLSDMAQSLKKLFRATDMQVAVNRILETIGHIYDVSRVYIFEASEDGITCSNTFEWCNEGIAPEIENLQNLSFQTDLAGIFDIYDETGVFYCQDISTLAPNLRTILEAQGIVAVLQCFILDEGNFKGFIGFDECRMNRYWTKEQIHTLTLISNILSSFLVKARLREQLSALRQQNE